MCSLKLDEFEKFIGVSFKNKRLLQQALTHESYLIESAHGETVGDSNERLEFLGDSILNAVVSSYLYAEHPGKNEGYLSKRKSYLVSKRVLKKWAQQLRLGEYLFLGKGEESTGGKTRPSLLADSLEALVGAIYLDAGFDTAREFILKLVREEAFRPIDYKSQLQEEIQGRYRKVPVYRVVGKAGPSHAPLFEVEVKISDRKLGGGKGNSRKEAEQNAAEQALQNLSKLK